MRTMKDSGLSWVGEIPSDWVPHPVYYYFGERKNKNIFGQEDNLLSLSYGRIIRRDINTNGGLLPESFNTYNIVEAGDIIIRPTDLQNDKKSLRTGLCLERGIITSAYIALRPIRRLNSGFFRYLLHVYDISKVFYNMGNGVRQGLNFSEFSRLMVFEPPIEIQDKITQYLDTATAEVDEIISDIQTQIDTLEQYKRSVITETVTKGLNPNAEMKDSGVFYMAPMNASWRLTKIGYICTKLSRSFVSEDTALICSNKGKVQIRADDLTGIMVSDDNAMQGIRAGDIAIHGMDTWQGAIALSEFDGKITRVVHVCDSTEDKRFIVYYMQHLAFQGVYKLISNGVRGNTSDFRSWDKVRDIWIAIPETKEEQAAICDYLDSQCTAVEEVIATKKEQLEVLGEYKKSLIFEYVTGKKEVI